MTSATTPLNQLPLRDIHLPDAVSWWPPAAGWWLLLFVLLILILLTPRVIKKLKNKPVNKIAQLELSRIEQSFKQNSDTMQLAQDISVLLRRICLSYKPREEAASLTGTIWFNYLNNMTDKPCFSEQQVKILSTAPYQKQSEFDGDELIRNCKQWIAQLPRRRIQ